MALVYDDLGKVVTEAWNELNKKVPPKFFVEQINGAMGLGSASALSYIHCFKGGMPYGTISDQPLNPNERLARLSVFLFAIGFSVEDEKYKGVIDGVKSMAEKRGDTFTFPPPEDKRISREYIIAKYDQEKSIKQKQEKGITPSNNGAEDVSDIINAINAQGNEKGLVYAAITSLFAASGTNGHKAGQKHGYLQTDIGYITGLEQAYCDWFNSGGGRYFLRVNISSEFGGNTRAYSIYYQGSFGWQVEDNAFIALQQFLKEATGKKALIAHQHHGLNQPTISMISVDQSSIVYCRNSNGILSRYDLKTR